MEELGSTGIKSVTPLSATVFSAIEPSEFRYPLSFLPNGSDSEFIIDIWIISLKDINDFMLPIYTFASIDLSDKINLIKLASKTDTKCTLWNFCSFPIN